jgi:hypothetical protein
MAAMIGRGKSWVWWLAGCLCALVFGRSVVAGEASRKYGVIARPPVEQPDKPVAKPAASLEESADWKTVTEAWDFCMPLATSGKSTNAQRKEADGKLKAAREAAERLAAVGLLAAAEAGLLSAETDKIRAEIYRNPPTDSMVECYDVAYLPLAQQSFDRLAKRLPLLEKLTEGGKVNRAAVEKVLATVEADVAVLADEKKLGGLGGDDKKTEAAKLRDAVKAQVGKLKKLLDEAKKP